MGCGCKGNSASDKSVKFSDLTHKAKLKRVWFYSLKSLAFLVGILALPIINIAIIWFMFKIIVLNRDFDVKNIGVQALDNLLNKKNDEEDDEDDDLDDYDEDDVVMLDVDEITYKK